MKKETGEHKKHSRVLGSLALLSAYCAAFICSYGITSVIYRFIGQPSELLRHLLTGIIALALIMVVWRLILQYGGGHHREEYHRDIHNQLTDTLARIAQGDFNVLLNPDSIGMYNDLAEAINNMAQNLGTLETMRQDFISNVSHEIQSPLTSIGGFAALLKQDDLPMDERKRYAIIIEAESRRLSSLSDNLLKLSALDNKPLAKTEYRLDKQLSNVILTLEPQWSAKNLNVEADLRKCAIYGDEDLLSQVWVNLLVNAIKFTPDGGNICITLDQNTVKIADTGVGIGEEDLPHIFERFYKVDKSRDRSLGGNGLGLSLAKRIVELHNGTIAAQSEPGKGTAFTISLP